MARNHIAPGETRTITTAAAVAVNDIVVIGASVGVALTAASGAGEQITARIVGAWDDMPKAAGTAWSDGDKLDFDVSEGEFAILPTPATGDIVGCAMAYGDAADAATAGAVQLTPNTGAVS